MGLASSQARLLNLTSRMHQIEYKAAKLEAQKLQLANESSQVYENYIEALDKTKVQYKILNTDGSATYSDISSYQDFINAGYALQFNGAVYDNTSMRYKDESQNSYIAGTPITVNDSNCSKFGITKGTDGTFTPATIYPVSVNGEEQYSSTDIATGKFTPFKNGSAGTAIDVTGEKLDFAQLCEDAFGAETAPTGKDVEKVITNLINSGDVTIVSARADKTFAQQADTDYSKYETSVSTNTGLQEVSDEVALKKAEAQYEADMKKIDRKDTKFDTELSAIETERNAIKQEMETLKTVAKDNVERTFKLFG